MALSLASCDQFYKNTYVSESVFRHDLGSCVTL